MDDSEASRKRWNIKGSQQLALDAIRARAPGSELAVLEALRDAVMCNQPIDPYFQAVANAVMTKCVAYGRMPEKVKGRPKQDDRIGWWIAFHYYQMRDDGATYREAIEKLVAIHHKDERHLMRHVEKNTESVGATLELRQAERDWHDELIRSLTAAGKIGPGCDDRTIEELRAAIDWKAHADRSLDRVINDGGSLTDKK